MKRGREVVNGPRVIESSKYSTSDDKVHNFFY